jgi:hypothetical protein
MCKHGHVMGDNYGETCMDCGEVVSGYGYWAEGNNGECIHRWVPDPDENDDYLVCCFCMKSVSFAW